MNKEKIKEILKGYNLKLVEGYFGGYYIKSKSGHKITNKFNYLKDVKEFIKDKNKLIELDQEFNVDLRLFEEIETFMEFLGSNSIEVDMKLDCFTNEVSTYFINENGDKITNDRFFFCFFPGVIKDIILIKEDLRLTYINERGEEEEVDDWPLVNNFINYINKIKLNKKLSSGLKEKQKNKVNKI